MPSGCVAHLTHHDVWRTVAGDLRTTNVAPVAVKKLLGHATMHTTTHDD